MHIGVSLVHVLLLALRLVQASSGAYWVQPSQKWVEVDGTWSTFEVNLGAPAQPVQLLVSTAISEVWAIGKGGCLNSNTACTTDRGNIYNAGDSQNYASLGAWDLGLITSSFNANGDYGLDKLSMFNSLEGETISINNALVASVNTTEYYQGYIGLGVIRGRFGDRMTVPLISQMVEEYGLIASNSYGYTAGAWHIDGGVPASLILGGYDPLRFQSHNTPFNLNPDSRLPQVRVRGINVATKDPSKRPLGWAGQLQKSLVEMNDSLVVTIDTSLPYLALPGPICDRFAEALNLTYNSTLDVYVLTGDQLTNVDSPLRADRLNFTFSLSSWDNNDSLGKPLEAPGVINITISGQAFTQYLTYPYKNIFGQYDSGVPYFPLHRASNVNELVIGRAFMQEAYLITKYEERVFSVYQARFPRNAASNYSVKSISRPPNSDFPAFVPKPQNGPRLTAGETAGIVVGVVGASVAVCFALWLWRRRRRSKAALDEAPMSPSEKNGDELCQDGGSTLGPDEPAGRLTRFVSFITRGRRPRRTGAVPLSHELDGSRMQPVEVGADATHERYEMPAPPEPVELDATHDYTASDEVTEFGTESSEQGMSEYEITRRKLQRQLQGPLPTYTPAVPTVHVGHPTIEGASETKSVQDVSPIAHYRPGEDENPSPTVSTPSEGNNTNMFPSQIPSPMSPNLEWGTRFLDLPSPSTATLPAQFPLRRSGSAAILGPRKQHGGLGRSASTNNGSGNTAPKASRRSLDFLTPSPSIQRTPIDQSEIVCLGPLPENMCLPNQQPQIPRNDPTILPSDSASQAAGAVTSDALPSLTRQFPVAQHLQNPTWPTTTPTQSQLPSADPRRGLRIETPRTSSGQVRRVSRRTSSDTLGSDFTVDEEERMIDDDTKRQTDTRSANADGVSPQSTTSPERIDAATELIHIPQVSERRYSWEDDKR